MVVSDFVARQAARRVLPLVSRMSEKDLEGVLEVWEKLAPHEFATSVARTLSIKCREHDPMIELLRRAIRQTSPHVRETMVSSLLVKNLWFGSLRRHELLQQKVFGERVAVPWLIIISPTMRCNLRCAGCSSRGNSTRDDLEFEALDQVLTECADMGVYIALIMGGEPFVRHDMWEIYRRHSDILFHVFTNGTLIDAAAARRIERLGNVLVAFTLEGSAEETDARRGRGAFNRAMLGMDCLREVGAPFGFSVMVTRQNIRTVISDSFNDMLIRKGCLLGWHFLQMPVGRDPDPGLMPTPEQRELLRQRGARRLRREKPILAMDFCNDAPYVGGCIAGGRCCLYVNSRGDVEPCPFVHLATDNIKHKSLRAALNSPYFKAIRARQPYSDNLLRPCMIIDHPHVLREICARCHPYPTQEGADALITTLAPELDRYACSAAAILDPVWEREYVPRGFGLEASSRSDVEEAADVRASA